MALTISGTSNGKLGNLSLSASTGDILDSANTTFFGVDLWRLTANFNVTSSATSSLDSATTVTGWERNDNAGFGYVGTGLTESSGIFTFPSTGIYFITVIGVWGQVANNYQTAYISTTQDNSTYNYQTINWCWNNSGDYATQVGQHIFDVTDVSQCKFKIQAVRDYANNSLLGGTGETRTHITVQRMGDA